MESANSLPAIRIQTATLEQRKGKRPRKRRRLRGVAYAAILGAMGCVGAIYAVSGQPAWKAYAFRATKKAGTVARSGGAYNPHPIKAAPGHAPPKAKPQSSTETVRETRNGDGTYTLELPKGRFKQVTDPYAVERPPARQDDYDPNKYLVSNEEVPEIGREEWEAWKKRDEEINAEMIRDWENTVRQAEEARARRAAAPPNREELKKEYEAAYQRGYADVQRWGEAIERHRKANTDKMIIEQEITALDSVVENYASQYLKAQRWSDELVRAYGPGKRAENAVVIERTRGGYEGAKAAASRYAR